MPLGLLPALSDCRTTVTLPNIAACAPPARFRAAEGVRSAWPVGDGPFGRTPDLTRISGTGAQREGIRYERKALKMLATNLGEVFTPHQWFRFTTAEGVRWCQVDGVTHTPELTTIFEVKLRFTSDAWWQLRKLYEPVIRRAYYPKDVALVIVCRSFDPAVPFPEPVSHLRKCVLPRVREGDCTIHVLQWRPEKRGSK